MNNKWIPFTANTVSTISPPGFVWDATMMYMGIPIQVRDMFIKNKGTMEASLFGVYSIVRLSDTPEANIGELMRWLAEIVLYPSAFLLEQWKFTPSSEKVTVELQSYPDISIDFYFDEKTNLIYKIYAIRPKLVGNETILSPWEGHMFDYKLYHDVYVPTRMEVGWYEDGELELYFKGYNLDFDFQNE